MTFRYSKKVVRKDLIFGSLFLILGLFFIWEEPSNVIRYGFLLISLLHLISGFYQLKMPYLKLGNGSITRGGLISKSVSISEVERIRKFGGDYTLYTADKKLKINTEFTSKPHTAEFDDFLRALEIPFEETPPKEYKYS